MLDSNENIREGLLKLKPNKDYIWAAVKVNLFNMYTEYFGDKPHSYFGHVAGGQYFLEGKSLKIYKLKKLLYLGELKSMNTCNKIFFFKDNTDTDLRFSGYILTDPDPNNPNPNFYNKYCDDVSLVDVFDANFDKRHLLDRQLIAFLEEDGLKICRELNNNWKNDLRYVGFSYSAPYIKKTLDSMLIQLDSFMRSEYMLDPEEAIKKDLKDPICDT